MSCFAKWSDDYHLHSLFCRPWINEERVGVFMSCTLLGDVIISFCLVLVADSVGRRKILAIGSVLMCISGITFSYSSNLWILLSAAVFGVISPSGSEIGPFKTIEESTLAHLSDLTTRSELYAWYNLLGGVGLAIGTISGGWIVQILQDNYAWSALASFRFIFALYSIIAALKLLASLLLSSSVDLNMHSSHHHDLDDDDIDSEEGNQLLANPLPGSADDISYAPVPREDVTDHLETTITIDNQPEVSQQPVTSSTTTFLKRMSPQLSSQSCKLVFQLVCLFSIDSFASGIASQSWLSYYCSERFGTKEGTLGTMFFVTNFISAGSSLLAAPLSKRLGLIKTIAFTHLPSSILLLFVGVPSSQYLAMILLILRSCTQRMDYGPTQAFVSAVVLKEERTTVMGVVNLANTFAQSLSPLVIGRLAFLSLMPIGFSLAGVCKVLYDISLLVVFIGPKLYDN
ncbi:major facilitator superfamily domain-containing protein [Lipomyces doorenjongii]